MVYGRHYPMQMQKNRVISKCWKLVWCMADPTLCRCRKIESSASVGNLYGVWQNLLYADPEKSSHQQVLETHMVYGRPYSMQMQIDQVISKGWKFVWCMADTTYTDAEKSSHHQVLEIRMAYGRPYSMQMQTNRVISKGWKLIRCMADTTLYRCI